MSQPTKIPRPFADSGDKNSIPDSTGNIGFASWQEGFPAITSEPFANGGVAPKRADFNGIFNALSLATVWQQQGGVYAYDNTTDYEVGNLAEDSGDIYQCMVANGPNSTIKSPSDQTVWSKVINVQDLNSILASYLPLAGGTLTGPLVGANGLRLTTNGSAYESRLCGGTGLSDGATLIAYGKDNGSGIWRLRAYGDHDLIGNPNGTLTWDGKDVATIQTGTWTPALYFISPNSGDVTYLTQSATYTLIGDLVRIYGTLSFKINVVPSNYVAMSGLPFAASGFARFALSPNRWLRAQSGTTQAYVQKVRTDTGTLTELYWSTVDGTTNYRVAVGDTITWEFSGWYRK